MEQRKCIEGIVGCICVTCGRTIPQGDSSDCRVCDICIKGDMKKPTCGDLAEL